MILGLFDTRTEPNLTMNGILGPIIEELEQLKDGFQCKQGEFKVQLLNIALDDQGTKCVM